MPEHVANAIERRVSDGMAKASFLLVKHQGFHNELAAVLFRAGWMTREEIDAVAKKHGV